MSCASFAASCTASALLTPPPLHRHQPEATPEEVAYADADFVLAPAYGDDHSSHPAANVSTAAAWKNYTVTATSATSYAILLEAAPGGGLDNFGHGICGNDPKEPGRGLCQKCPTQLYADNFDCTGSAKCLFGVAGGSMLVAWSDGGQVFYTKVTLR